MTDRTTQHRVRLLFVVSLLLFGGLLFSVPTGGDAGQPSLEPGTTISTAGNYELSGDATTTDTSKGVTVTGSPVEIDGRGYRFDGPDTAASVGVYVPADAGVSSLVVRNIVLSGWETGVLASNVSTVTIRDSTVYSNHTGIRVEGADTVRIEDSTLVVDDGTYFEDVDRLILENSSITTDGSESVIAENTTVYVGRRVRMTGGIVVRSGVVRVPAETAIPESGDAESDVDTATVTDPDNDVSDDTEPTTTVSPVESDGGSGEESSSDTGGSAPSAGGAVSGPIPVSTATLPDGTTVPPPETAVATGTTQARPNDTEPDPNATRPDDSSKVKRTSGSGTVDSPTTNSDTVPGRNSATTTGQQVSATESTPVQTPGFGVLLTLAALVVWLVLSKRWA